MQNSRVIRVILITLAAVLALGLLGPSVALAEPIEHIGAVPVKATTVAAPGTRTPAGNLWKVARHRRGKPTLWANLSG